MAVGDLEVVCCNVLCPVCLDTSAAVCAGRTDSLDLKAAQSPVGSVWFLFVCLVHVCLVLKWCCILHK